MLKISCLAGLLFFITSLVFKNPSAKNILKDMERNMVLVKGGDYIMGCDEKRGSDCMDNQKPAHRITVASFYMSKFEVSQEQYEFVTGNNPAHHKNCPNCPVEEVSWNEAQAFITKLNELSHLKYRLPTEAEWEYAAAGGAKSKGFTYSGSNEIEQVAWYKGDAADSTHTVGSKQANELGLYDLSGNVAEWCSDWYSGSYYMNSGTTNVRGPERGREKVVRGGSWDFIDSYCSRSFRLWNGAAYRNNYTGFRLARTQ